MATFPLDEHLRLRNNGHGPQTRLLCGGFTLSSSSAHLVGTLLPDLLHMKTGGMGATAWLEPVLLALDAEVVSQQPGATAIKEKIADVFVAQALRAWMVGAGAAGWRLPADQADARITKALDAMRNRLAEKWTLDRLAAHVGLSRTALTTRFRDVVGEPPMRYLTKLRLGSAAGYLATDDRSMYEIALLTGYDSDASLSKAFRREFGVPPGAYRQSSRERPTIVAE
jgi:transcriptional regulator GlxA family with amidase domain